jgi:hypothetical protein
MKRGEREVIESAVGFNSRDHTEFSHAGAVGRRLEIGKLRSERDCHQ